MEADRITLIETWFAEERDDGEFVVCSREFPYSVVPPQSDSACIIVTTKPQCVAREVEVGISRSPFGMIGRYGLPDPSDVAWLRDTIGPRPPLGARQEDRA